MKNFLLLLTVFSGVMVLFGYQTYAQTFTNYTIANTSTALCDNSVTFIAIDAQGNKWFGTYYGVS
ncbi:MAG TPA: hypothetical protein PK715_06820, partial [Chitinophagales bacterium]|nr:hypothetical protein [Chitinophagales bacterium]